ncbi:MAG: Rieske (2Fe-2S) protein [Bacteroidales bacterium]|nr:Rieske (2Fe-2S) protein [Bacteroidales bacterium]
MENRQNQLGAPAVLRITPPEHDGVYFHDGVILVKQKGRLLAIEARCTHLGCRIEGVHEGVLHCPCHGSQFNLEGEVIRGPAAGSLQRLTIGNTGSDGMITIQLGRTK